MIYFVVVAVCGMLMMVERVKVVENGVVLKGGSASACWGGWGG